MAEYLVVQRMRTNPNYRVVIEAFDSRKEAEDELRDREQDPLYDAVTYFEIEESIE